MTLTAILLGALLAAPPNPAPPRARAAAPPPTCDYCGMFIEQRRFGGRLDTVDRQTFRFDATECLAAFMLKPPKPHLAPTGIWSVRWDRPDSVVDARRASYLVSERLPSPMALGLSAWPGPRAAAAARAKHGGRVLDWEQVLALVRERWLRPAGK